MSRTWTALYGSICTSKKLARCASDSSRVFYLLLLNQVDAWGRTEDDAETLCARVWPLLGKSEKDTEKALADLHEVGLITRHSHESVKFVQVEGWKTHAGKHQGGSRGTPKFPELPRISPDLPGPSGEVRGAYIYISSPSSSPSSPESEAQRDTKPSESSPSRLVSDFWCSSFLKVRGAKYVWQGGKDGALLARLLKATGGDVAEIQRRAERFLTDPFWSEKADWSKFCSQYNAMAGNGKPVEDEFEKAARMLGVGRPS